MEVPRPPADVSAAKAHAVLDRHCARCHQSGKSGEVQASTGIANILALDEIARDPSLVRPGVPDASRLYTAALTWNTHYNAWPTVLVPAQATPAAAPVSAARNVSPGAATQPPPITATAPPKAPVDDRPSGADVQILRDWIAELPEKQPVRCTGRAWVSQASVAANVERNLAALEPERARQARFISLVPLQNACATPLELDGFREGLATAVGIVASASNAAGSPASNSASAEPIDDKRLIYRISLTALAMAPDQWEQLTATYPLREGPALRLSPSVADLTGSRTPIVNAAWLSHVLLAATNSAGDGPPAARVKAGFAALNARVWGLSPIEALSHAWRRPLDLERAAADFGLEPAVFRQRILGDTGAGYISAKILRHGVASRADVDLLFAALTTSPAAAAPIKSDRLEIALWPAQERFSVGDAATFHLRSSQHCHATLISIDRAGRATVIFPNEFEPANQIAGGQVLQVPAPGAQYRFRLHERGRETLVAICTRNQKAPPGVFHDYDRLRFTVLGDWRIFLREPPALDEARLDDAATDRPRAPPPKRRGRGKVEKDDKPPVGPDPQARTAIVINVE